MNDNEARVCVVAIESLGDPNDPIQLEPDSDLAEEFNLSTVQKISLMAELEDAFEVPPNSDAKEDAADIAAISSTSWIVRDLARTLVHKKQLRKNTQ